MSVRQLLSSLVVGERSHCGRNFFGIGWSVLLKLGLLLAIDQSESVSTHALSTYRCLPDGQGSFCNRDKEKPITSHSQVQDVRSLVFDIFAVLLSIL